MDDYDYPISESIENELVTLAGDSNSSILRDMKQLLGVEEGSSNFDRDVIIHTNGAIFSLLQLGIGPKKGFSIKGYDEIWSDLIPDRIDLEGAKTYLYFCARLSFDPPQMGYYVTLMERQRDETAWRLVHQIEDGEGGEENVDNN